MRNFTKAVLLCFLAFVVGTFIIDSVNARDVCDSPKHIDNRRGYDVQFIGNEHTFTLIRNYEETGELFIHRCGAKYVSVMEFEGRNLKEAFCYFDLAIDNQMRLVTGPPLAHMKKKVQWQSGDTLYEGIYIEEHNVERFNKVNTCNTVKAPLM